ncbi:MAG: S1 RNA-binding domain-containing protein, partial [Oscillospiraceae bacterium]|nr:S1 RNA-binding domain-containing protein [Oscillospiraceae bacterium]
VKVVKFMPFGAFAEVLPGVDGLIHISPIADRRIGKPEDVLSEGQEVQVKITEIDAENKRISLSIRALLENSEEAAEETEEA